MWRRSSRSDMPFDYKVYAYDDCPKEVFNFRYEIYVEELHRKQSYADHDGRTIIDPLDETGFHGVVSKDGEIVAVVRLNFVRDGGTQPYFDFYELAKLTPAEQATASICTRNMVAAKYRKTGVSVRMLKMIYEFGIRNGATSCYMDVNAPLMPLFEKFGYEPLFEKEHPDYGLVTVMRLPAIDYDVLAARRSPFAPICKKVLSDRQELAPAD
ncbi:MAG: GNAT family N-acetyltransferase [Marinicaulis sp.]|nr:GNAT family N-acetyltransferase [Marinicaulis sp.]